MYKKYTLPISIFVVFNKINAVIWTSEKFQPNSFLIQIPKVWFFTVNIFLSNEIHLSNSSLIENSAINLKKNIQFFLKNATTDNNLIFYNYYFYFMRVRLVLLILNKKNSKIKSLDKIYKSSSWLERETGEMFQVLYTNKIDNRRLLLDYSKKENPMLKDFPTEGFNSVFYCFFENQVVNDLISKVEL